MATTLPADPTKVHWDQASDDVAQARTEGATLIDAVNTLLDALGGAAQLNTSTGLTTGAQSAGTPDDLLVLGGDGIAVAAGGVAVDLAASPALEITSAKLRVQTVAAGGIERQAAGIWFDILGMAEITSPDAAADFIPLETAAGALRKVKPSNLGIQQWVTLQTATASSDTELDLTTGIDSTYNHFRVIGNDIDSSSDDVELQLRVRTGGSTWHSGATSYTWSRSSAATSQSDDLDSDVSLNPSSTGLGYGTTAGEGGGNIEIHFASPDSIAFFKAFRGEHAYLNANSDAVNVNIGGAFLSTTAIDGIRFLFSTGNISGRFVLQALAE